MSEVREPRTEPTRVLILEVPLRRGWCLRIQEERREGFEPIVSIRRFSQDKETGRWLPQSGASAQIPARAVGAVARGLIEAERRLASSAEREK